MLSGNSSSSSWERGQVELKGRFSAQHMEYVRDYERDASWRRVLLGHTTTSTHAAPFHRLYPAGSGPLGTNRHLDVLGSLPPGRDLHVRGALNHFRCRILSLPLSFRDGCWIAIVTTAISQGFIYAISLIVVRPEPFMMLVESACVVPVIFLLLGFTDTVEAKRARKPMATNRTTKPLEHSAWPGLRDLHLPARSLRLHLHLFAGQVDLHHCVSCHQASPQTLLPPLSFSLRRPQACFHRLQR